MRVLLALTVVTVVGLAGTPTLADEDDGIGKIKTGMPNAVTPVPNSAQPSLIDPDFALRHCRDRDRPVGKSKRGDH